MSYVNFKELYDEKGAWALIPHCFSNSEEAYDLLTQKLRDEVDLLYLHSLVTNMPFIEDTLDGTVFSVFDKREDAEMKHQELSILNYDVELRNFMNLTTLDLVSEETTRKDIFIILYNLGIRVIRMNEMISIPIGDITEMPERSGFSTVDELLTNPALWYRYLVYKQADDAKEDSEPEFRGFLNELIKVHVCAPLIMTQSESGTSLTTDAFKVTSFYRDDEEDAPYETILLFPDNNALLHCMKSEEFEFLDGLFTPGIQWIHPFEAFLFMTIPLIQTYNKTRV